MKLIIKLTPFLIFFIVCWITRSNDMSDVFPLKTFTSGNCSAQFYMPPYFRKDCGLTRLTLNGIKFYGAFGISIHPWQTPNKTAYRTTPNKEYKTERLEKSLVVSFEKELAPKLIDGKKLTLNGKKCEAIYWTKSEPGNAFYDKRAAKMIRFGLYRCGGKYLPVKEIANDADYKKDAIFVGKAAEKLMNNNDVSGINLGGCAILIKNGQGMIWGKRPGGVTLGAMRFLETLGIKYLALDIFSEPKKFALTNFYEKKNPGVIFREADGRYVRRELLGFSPIEEEVDNRILNKWRASGHNIPLLVSWKEFGKTHPEFFALNEDGSRGPSAKTRNHTHYCYAADGFVELAAQRMIEMMDNDPKAILYNFYEGDGGEFYCRCEKCAAMGSNTDRMLAWTNKVARIIAKKHPEKFLKVIAYTRTCKPPEKVKPEKNVIVDYCVYPVATWPNSMIYKCPENADGIKYLVVAERIF